MAEARAREALERVRIYDPSWRPRPSAYETPEGEIRHLEAVYEEAQGRLDELNAPVPRGCTASDLFAPGGVLRGTVYRGAKSEIRTVSEREFDDMMREFAPFAEPVRTPETYKGQWYRLRDGSVIGVRRSEENGLTLDSVHQTDPMIPRKLKVHHYDPTTKKSLFWPDNR